MKRMDFRLASCAVVFIREFLFGYMPGFTMLSEFKIVRAIKMALQ